MNAFLVCIARALWSPTPRFPVQLIIVIMFHEEEKWMKILLVQYSVARCPLRTSISSGIRNIQSVHFKSKTYFILTTAWGPCHSSSC
jgi:hypothetical protein